MRCTEFLIGAKRLVVYEIALLACPDVIPAAGRFKIRFVGRFEQLSGHVPRKWLRL